MKLASAPASLAKVSREGIEPPRPATTPFRATCFTDRRVDHDSQVARVRFERTASLPLKESGLPIAYRAAMARAGFEPAAFRGLSPDGLPLPTAPQ